VSSVKEQLQSGQSLLAIYNRPLGHLAKALGLFLNHNGTQEVWRDFSSSQCAISQPLDVFPQRNPLALL
jgi:hypothetical protein